MPEKIKFEFKKFGFEPTKVTEKTDPTEETIKEITQHLGYIERNMLLKLAYRREKERPGDIEESKRYEKEEKLYNELFESAKKQLADRKAGNEILKIILDFHTEKEESAKDNLHRIKGLLRKQNLDPDNLPPEHSSKGAIDSYKEQIEAERQKRESWAKQVEGWGKKE